MASEDLKRYKFVKKGYYWETKITCPICGKERWARDQTVKVSKNFTERCLPCNSRVMMKGLAKDRQIDTNRLEKEKGIKLKLVRNKKGKLGTYITCPKCKETRWVLESNIYKSKNFTKRCAHCNTGSGSKNPHWKGGRIRDYFGYIKLLLTDDDPFYCMANKNGYVLEHRYLVAKKLGRPLKKHEVVHHLNGIRDDNRTENLELIGGKNATIKHTVITAQQQKIKSLEEKVEKLEEELNT